jgi:uncharacterized protein (TIGR02246 family)
MGRVSTFVTIAFLAGLGIGLFVRGSAVAAPRPEDTHAADLAAIERLHNADVEATLTQDPAALTKLWSHDAVKLDVPGAPWVGIKAIQEGFEKSRADHPDFQVSRYSNDITEIQIVTGWAIEVGYIEATYKMSAKSDPVSVPRTQNMRVLRRQSDGSWKFALVGMK